MHDPTKVLLGATLSSDVLVTPYASDPADTPAAFAVCQDDDGSLSLAQSDGRLVGVSLGKSLSNSLQTSVCRTGLRVPIRCANQYAHGLVTITSFANLVDDTDDTIEVAGTVFTFQTGSVTPGQATVQAASSNGATATSLAAQINAHASVNELVEATANGSSVYIRALEAGDDGEELTLVYDDVDGTGDSVGLTVTGSGTLIGGGNDFVINKGAPVYVDTETGLAVGSDTENAIATNALYAESGTFTAVDETGAVVLDADDVPVVVALIDMPGGL